MVVFKNETKKEEKEALYSSYYEEAERGLNFLSYNLTPP
jgi:hypothetical protein